MANQAMDGMKEGVQQSDCVLAIISGGGVKEHRYFERPMCVQELKWAAEAGKPIVPVVNADDKKQVGGYIEEGKAKGVDLSACDFQHVDRSKTIMMQVPFQAYVYRSAYAQRARCVQRHTHRVLCAVCQCACVFRHRCRQS